MRSMLTLSAALLFPLAALAQAPPQAGAGAASPFDELDSDKNTVISATEAQAHPIVAQHFGAADRDGNKSLSRDEFNAAFVVVPPRGGPAEPSAAPAQPASPTP